MRGAPVLVAGGGIAGLACAIALSTRGMPAHVLERRTAFAEAGAGIQIGPNATRILDELRLAGALEPIAGRPDAVHIRRGRDGRRLARLPLGDWIARRHGAPYWTLHRADLHGALLARARSADGVTVSLGWDVAGARTHDGGIRVVAADGREIMGRVLVEASGVWAAMQPGGPEGQLGAAAWRGGGAVGHGGVRGIATGYAAARAVLPRDAMPAGSADNAIGLWLMRAGHVVHYPVRGGAETALVAIFRAGEGEGAISTAAPLDAHAVLARLPPLCSELESLLGAGRGWQSWPLRQFPPRGPFAEGLRVPIGDAAHPMLPYLAQGGAMALEDAAMLARALEHASDDAAALKSFGADRQARTARVAAQSRANGAIYHAGRPWALARDMVLQGLPGRALIGRYDWLYGWRPGNP